MTKAVTLTLKTRAPDCGEVIEIETVEGWERVTVTQCGGPIDKASTWLSIEFDDGSYKRVTVDNINWRRPPH